ncbi:hypothetical protein ACFO0N_11740 [Halobium salinum]|uniref:MFS transporter n=1 Tax=Halobium salinum TaxID=1364940 RepID=A0ABD5PCL5_9EURY|nr:hypothetical protein [Halobium salinum]
MSGTSAVANDGDERTNGHDGDRKLAAGEGATGSADDADDTETHQRGVDRSPATFSASLSLLAGLFSVLGSGLGVLTAAAPGFAGLLVLAAGLYRGSRRAVTGGGVVLLGGVVFAGVGGGPPAGLLLGALGALLAWDYGENAITMGEQLGRAADTRRAELFHAAASLGVGVVGSGVVYGIYLGASGGQPVTALVFLLLAVVLLAGVLSE